jgi:hypothetical protein
MYDDRSTREKLAETEERLRSLEPATFRPQPTPPQS